MVEPHRPKERRLHPRYVVEGKVELGVGKEGPALLRDLSMSGLSCVSPKSFDEMTVLEITMQLPMKGGKQPFKAGGAVVRCEKSKAGGHLVAVFFTQMDAANSRVLSDFISEQAR
ncbi:MAG TPA: PilZ domain-containing protein [Planctomycetota bacterium]|nr:PilZ domain-containing protein [Planctomycetota bacterium]